jgi:hypothetical protein
LGWTRPKGYNKLRSSTSSGLIFETTAACDEFPAACREGARRVRVAAQHRKESSADVVRRCTQNTLMLPCRSKTVDHACDIDGRGLPASRSQVEPRPNPHPRVLRASPFCICVEFLALRCRGPILAHALPGPRRRARFWRYTLARRVYGAPPRLQPTPALRASVVENSCDAARVSGSVVAAGYRLPNNPDGRHSSRPTITR